MVKKIQYFIALLVLASVVLAFSLDKKPGPGGVKTIVIDPGHGGRDPGCHGVTYKEKDVSLAVALKLGKYIEDNFKDVKVIYTRTTDVFVELEDRAQIANKAKADLFISIHCNAAGKPVFVKDKKTGKKRKKMYRNAKGKMVTVETINPAPFGTETYVMGLKNEEGKMRVATRENSVILLEEDYEKKYGGFDPESEESYIIMSNYTSAYVIQSANLAVKIQDEYAKKAGRIDKGVHRQSIWVLWRTSMPSILTEIGYLTNPLEETFLGSEQGQDYLAKSIFKGLRRYKDEVEGAKKEYNDAFENLTPLENENIKAGNQPYVKRNDEDEEEEDKKTSDTLAIKTNTVSKENEPKKIPVKDGKAVDVSLTKTDSAKAAELKDDTILTAKKIAEKYKREKKKLSDLKPLEETDTPKEKEIKNPEANTDKATKEISFRVQFASSPVLLDLTQDRYKVIINEWHYKDNTVYKYTSGNFTSFKTAVMHQNILRDKGFTDCFVVAFKNGQRMDLNAAKKAVSP